MPGRKRQIIAITLIAALWMPVVILSNGASASSTAVASGSPGSTASLFSLAWAKLATLIPGAAQEDETAPPGMPALKQARRQHNVPGAPLSKEDRKAKVASLKINPENEMTLEAGQQLVIAATALDSEGNPVHGLGAEWASNRPDVVSITADGLATAGETGKARLTVSAGNKQETLSVTVIPAQPRQNGSAQQSASINTGGLQSRGIQSQGLNRERENTATTEASTRSDRSLSHAPRLSRVRAASLAPQGPILDEDSRRYISEVGAPPGQAEPGAATPPAAIGGTEKPGTANFNFDVPVLGLSGRGLDVSLSLVYNSRLWNKKKNNNSITTVSYDVDKSWPAPGFTLGFGKLMPSSGGYVLIDAGGTRHPLRGVNGANMDETNQWETSDGTFIKVNWNNYLNGSSAVFADGTQVLYGAKDASNAFYPIRITDRHGNFINISYVNGVGPRISTIQDTLERVVTFNYAGNDLVAINVPSYAGTGPDRQTIRFYYRDIVVNPTGSASFSGISVPVASQNKAVRVISHVYFPGTQTGYAYSYAEPYGMISRIEQRREMTVSTTDLTQLGSVTGEGMTAAWTEYNYPTAASSLSDVPKYTRRTDDWAGRTGGGAAPFYTFNVTEGTTNNISTVTAPDGTTTETEIFAATSSLSGLVKQTTIKRADGAVLNKTVLAWGTDELDNNARLTQVLSTNDAGQTKAIVYTYEPYQILSDNFNNVIKVSERDFTSDGTLSSVELRRTETTYEKGTAYLNRRLLHLPTSIKVFAGGSNVAASFVEYKYDEGGEAALTGRAGLLMYTSPQTSARGNVTKVIAYSNAAAPDILAATVNQSVYDTTGNAVSLTLNCCQQKTITYGDAYKFAYPTQETKGTAPDQLTTSSTYDYNTGVVRTSTDENNQVTTLYYHSDPVRIDYIQRPDTSYTRWHYHEGLVGDPDSTRMHSYVAVATLTAWTPVQKVLWDYKFMDGRGAVVRHFKSNPQPDQWETTDIEYNQMGRLYRTSNPYYSMGCNSAIPSPGLWTTIEQYDGLGRATHVRLPDNTLAQTSFTGTTITVTDQAGRQRRQLADALGRVVRVDEPDQGGSLGSTSSPAQPTAYGYDALDNLTTVTQTDFSGITQQRVFRYDSLGHMTHQRQIEANPTLDDNGVRVGSTGQWTGVYKYNSHGLLIDSYDARGVHTTLEYDGLNRIRRVSYAGEGGAVRTPAVIYSYDQAHNGYYNQGRLTEVRTEAVSGAGGVQAVPQTIQAYDYDLMGRVVNQRQNIGTDAYSLSYSFNYMGQLTSQTYPSGRIVSYEFDDGARLSHVRNGSTGSSHATSFTYKAHGGLASMTLGNGAVQTVSYNERLQPMQIKLSVAGVERQRFDYQYGVVNLSTGTVDATKNTGQVASVEGFIDGVRQWQQRFAYDSIGRLDKAAEHKGNDLSLTWKADYDFDRFGNRTQSSAENQGIPYHPVTAAEISKSNNRLITNTTYDDAGNVTVDEKFRTQQYAYDGNGRQVRVAPIGVAGESTAVYDGLGQRVQTTTNGTTKTLVYDQFGQLVAEYGGQVIGTGGVRYVMADQQGSTRVVMNAGAGIEARHDYSPFGEEITSNTGLRTSAQGYSVTDSTRQRYAGMERDESGLDHTLWRKYEQRGGRWTTPDPYNGSMSISDPQSFNRFSYVGNDPVNRIDPSGLFYLVDGVSGGGIGGFQYGPDGVYGGIFGDLNILILRGGVGSKEGHRHLDHYGDIAFFIFDPLQVLKLGHAFGDADTVLRLDKSCQAFFTKGRSLAEVQAILRTLGKTVAYEPDREIRAATDNSGQGANSKIIVTNFFFSDTSDRLGYYYNNTEKRYEHREYGLTPRQFRALTVLHELAHALDIIPKDRSSADKTGKRSDENDDTINDKCGLGLGNLPTND